MKQLNIISDGNFSITKAEVFQLCLDRLNVRMGIFLYPTTGNIVLFENLIELGLVKPLTPYNINGPQKPKYPTHFEYSLPTLVQIFISKKHFIERDQIWMGCTPDLKNTNPYILKPCTQTEAWRFYSGEET